MLSDRRQRVLAALIEEYVACALPVGSRTLTERYKLGVSPATVRNELSVLEDAGYIRQPHTSAGRIPTDFGYRAFVDELLSADFADDDQDRDGVVDGLRATATELDSLLEQTSAALSRMTDCLSIVLAPSLVSLHIKQLSLISLSPFQALIVAVTEDGQVFNRHIEFSEEVKPDDLARVQNLLNKVFEGRTMNEAQTHVDGELGDASADPLVHAVVEEVLACFQENSAKRTHRLGFSALLRKPEFSHSQALLPIMQFLEDDTVLLEIFGDEAIGEGPVVKIGAENNAQELAGVSVVASEYGRGDAAGIIAVMGPTRMDYSKAIKAVHAAKLALHNV